MQILSTPGFEPQILQSVAYRYTYYVIPANLHIHIHTFYLLIGVYFIHNFFWVQKGFK
jgi:hypothetical protein